ncbi:MAG: DUF504 domain-containing protein [Nanoarchaeota archaeon]|nr:DUF504 domain-containing protein [Nanoarchaeota archaeon]
MLPIKDLLNRIRWDDKENPEDYEIVYTDRVFKKEIKIRFKDISRIEDEFMIVNEASIPLHRITKVYKKNKLIWERKIKQTIH